MSKLIKLRHPRGVYKYVSGITKWNNVYSDYNCTQLYASYTCSDIGDLLESPPILFNKDAITNVVKANLDRNELRYALWEIERNTQEGNSIFDIYFENPLSKESLNCLHLLGYVVNNIYKNTYRIAVRSV